MKQFAVISPLALENTQVIGRVSRIIPAVSGRRYTIHLSGLQWPYQLCSIADGKTGSRMFRYVEDPCLSVGDVLEISDSNCYVHYSSTSNDNCIVVTNACNERCINCPQPDKTKNPGLPERNAQLIKLLPKDVQLIALTGGEPTVDFPELLHLIKALYARNADVHIDVLTNGIELSDFSRMAELGKALKKQTSTFCITLYGDIPSIHDAHTRTPGSFAKVHRALHHLAYYGYSIELRYLITSMNYQRLPAFIEYVYDNFPFIDHISIMGMEFSGDAAVNAKQLFVAGDVYKTLLLAAVQKAVMRDIPIFIYNHQVCLLPKQLWRFAVASISDWKTGYYSQCDQCDVKGYCGGVFTTSDPDYIPATITPISLDYHDQEVI